MKCGERRVRREAAVAAVAEPPPGEVGRELTGSEALDSLHDALLDITGEPRVRFANVRDVDVKKVGRWVVIKVKAKGGDPNELTFRLSAAFAKVLKNRLRAVLGE